MNTPTITKYGMFAIMIPTLFRFCGEQILMSMVPADVAILTTRIDNQLK